MMKYEIFTIIVVVGRRLFKYFNFCHGICMIQISDKISHDTMKKKPTLLLQYEIIAEDFHIPDIGNEIQNPPRMAWVGINYKIAQNK